MRVVKYFGVEFKREKFTVPDGTMVTYTEVTKEVTPVPFTIKITKQGMWFEGYGKTKIVSEEDLQDFAKLVSEAWQDCRALKPKIIANSKDI